ncbi:MAG: class I SAM-dependent methyltransferase [Candidatus Thorarchaeota archaeon]
MINLTISQHTHESNLSFRIMASYLRFRERFTKPEKFLHKIGIKEGDVILDHGCGVGSYAIPAAKIVGSEGMVYALDIHPIAVERTDKRAKKEGLTNVKTILSGLENGLPDEHVDVAMLIDVFTMIQDMPALLKEFHRVLKPSGRLIILIDHASPEGCKTTVKQSGLFNLVSQEENLLTYVRI